MTKNLPDLYLDRGAPTQLSDLEGWTPEELEAWAVPGAKATVEVERRSNEMRVAVGLVLYRLRTDVGDGSYGEAVDRIAREAGVTARTLGRWRLEAEEHFQLGPPSPKAVGKREGVEKKQERELAKAADLAAKPQVTDLDTRPKPERGGTTTTSPAAPARSSLGQPTSQRDYRQLVAQIITAGPSVLAKSVDAEQLRTAARTIREALSTATHPATGNAARCVCPSPRPKAEQGAAGLLKCAGCGKLR